MLQFDAYQRYETVRQLLKWLLPEAGACILDVGGYPAPMRTVLPEHRWVVCDPLVDTPGDQVQGSAWQLPFADKAFEVSVSLDVLEHIAPEHRTEVLSEMARVSRRGLVISFPQNTDTVVQAETAVRERYEQWHGKPHPWLAEHAWYDLPDRAALVDHLAHIGGSTRVFPVGKIQRWARLQLLSILLEATPDTVDIARDLDALYENELFGHEFQEPAYRVVILHQFDPDASLPGEMIEPESDVESRSEMEFQNRVSSHLLGHLVALRDQSLKGESSRETNPVRESYIEALEQGVRSWEDTYTHALDEIRNAYAWRDALEQRLDFRLYRKLMRLLGARFPE